ncbi:RES family NAD+ phosphorylase [Oceanospirillum maris]|uniref:RES family NAD+ phosphorylase n=1 Tax=Oceanospirillum maris TaxID=64977 RepID=UPI00041E1682|nr:RES family NAD+ phosphorylase [Oceanospirillum maris]
MDMTKEDFIYFSDEVKSRNRLFLSDRSNNFLKWIEFISRSAEHILDKGSQVYRARVCEKSLEPIEKGGMKPIKNLGSEGRANAYNINMLYLASTVDTAIAEVRPSLSEPVTVAEFNIKKDLRIFDFARLSYQDGTHVMVELFNQDSELGVGKEDNLYLLRYISQQFSKPYSQRDQRREYLPTQVIAEYIKSIGFDGLCYQSQFLSHDGSDKGGVNYVLFDLDSADPVNCSVWKIEKQIIATKLISSLQRYR